MSTMNSGVNQESGNRSRTNLHENKRVIDKLVQFYVYSITQNNVSDQM